jgi:hypothetical protein
MDQSYLQKLTYLILSLPLLHRDGPAPGAMLKSLLKLRLYLRWKLQTVNTYPYFFQFSFFLRLDSLLKHCPSGTLPKYTSQSTNPVAHSRPAMIQKSHWFSLTLGISFVFMPKTEANMVSGRKNTVTVVKAKAAFSWLSLAASIIRKCYINSQH